MLKESLSSLVGSLDKANSVENYQKTYQHTLADDGQFKASPDFYLDATYFWHDNNRKLLPTTFKENILQIDKEGTFKIIDNEIPKSRQRRHLPIRLPA